MSYYDVRPLCYETQKFSTRVSSVPHESSIVLDHPRKEKTPLLFFVASPVMPARRFSLVAFPIAICSFILSRVRARVHGRTHSRAMALVLRGARAAGVLKQVATAPLAQVRPRGSRGPRCRRHRRVRSRSRAQPVCSYDRVSVDARLTPRPTPTRTQANAARGFSVTTAGRAGMGSPVPAHEPPTGPVRPAPTSSRTRHPDTSSNRKKPNPTRNS